MTAACSLTDASSPRVELFGIPVDVLTMDETIEQVRRMVSGGGVHRHVVVNAAKVVDAGRDPELMRAIRNCDLISADGASVIWASKLLRSPLPERVTGIDLFQRLVECAAEDGDAVYFLGAEEDVVTKVVETFSARHPRLQIAGYHNGFWTDDVALTEEIRAARPAYLFLAIPSPRKEFWLETNAEGLGVPFVMGVGGSFDVVAGRIGRAPVAVQRAGFEWAWRLIQEPKRMWRRYLFGNAAFLRLTFLEWRRRHS